LPHTRFNSRGGYIEVVRVGPGRKTTQREQQCAEIADANYREGKDRRMKKNQTMSTWRRGGADANRVVGSRRRDVGPFRKINQPV
jgi:hypothetical protein